MSQSDSLLDQLTRWQQTGRLPLHMPGHKRVSLDDRLPYGLDITEIDGFDDLHDAHGILSEGMARAAVLWGSDRCFYLVGGSTVGILSAIRAATRHGQSVIVARNCHKSVYHAIELCCLTPHWVLPQWQGDLGVWGSVTPAALETAFAAAPDAGLVVVTSPTYEGVISDIAALAAVAHAHGTALLVDEAHGAHLGFAPAFSGGAVSAGADLVVQSLHKTLPSLTQTALLHCSGSLVSPQRVARELNVFETSSPSYPLMASIDLCVRWLEEGGAAAFAAYTRRLEALDRIQWKHLRFLCHCGDNARPFYGYDPGKLVLSAPGQSGAQLASLLRAQNAEPEMVSLRSVTCMTSVMDSSALWRQFLAALASIDETLTAAPADSPLPCPVLPTAQLPPWQAAAMAAQPLPAQESEGKVAAETLWAYPPGIPLIVPGEVIPAGFTARLAAMQEAELHLVPSGCPLPQLQVVAEQAAPPCVF